MDSRHEELFSYWLDDCIELGIVKDWTYETKSYHLFDPCREFKLREHIYTPDFIVNWNTIPPKVRGVKWCLKNNQSIIEIKPSFDKYNMTRLFMLNQKWMFDKHNIYVQLLKIDTVFKNTFKPKNYKSKKEYLSKEQYKSIYTDLLSDVKYKESILHY